jgi:hypothetical protein
MVLDTDVLNANRDAMVAIGYLAEATFGSTTVVNGLSCVPNSPTPNLTVTVNRGMIASMNVIDQNPYGSLPADTADPLMKMGINVSATTLAITPPSTAGFSQNYLIECQFLEVGSNPIVLPYYNASNPSAPYSGPSNSGGAQNTLITQRASLQLIAGTPAAAGTQATPGATAGWTPLYVVSVTNGQTQITAANIAPAPGSPLLLAQLSQLRQKLTANLTLYVSSGNGNDTANNGRSLASPFATIQAAMNALYNSYDFNGFSATINVGAGTYSGAVSVTGLATGQTSPIAIVGAGSGSTTISGNIADYLGANIGVSNATLTGGISSNSGGNINVNSGIVFGPTTGAHIYTSGGVITLGSSYTISGGATYHYQSVLGGSINVFGSITITTAGTPAFTTFCLANGGDWSNLLGAVTFAGTGATGTRFAVSLGAGINTQGGGTSYFPGSVAGTTGSGTNLGFYA